MATATERQKRETQEERSRGTQQSQSPKRSEDLSMAAQSQSQNALASRQESMGMPALSSNPFGFMRRFAEDLEHLFGDFGFGWSSQNFGRLADWAPQIEMFERDGELHVRADLPGMKKDNVQIELLDHAIVLRGERREENKEEREGVYRTEVSYGNFYRELPLPPNVDTGNATAHFNNGVLEIRMPVTQGETSGRRLEIQDSKSQGQTNAKGQTAGADR